MTHIGRHNKTETIIAGTGIVLFHAEAHPITVQNERDGGRKERKNIRRIGKGGGGLNATSGKEERENKEATLSLPWSSCIVI